MNIIAICDDYIAASDLIKKLRYRFTWKQGLGITCDVFFDDSILIKSFNNGICYNRIYLDIKMQSANGICDTEFIRGRGDPALMVYVSKHEKCFRELFDTEPVRFLFKIIDMEVLKQFFWLLVSAYDRIGLFLVYLQQGI